MESYKNCLKRIGLVLLIAFIITMTMPVLSKASTGEILDQEVPVFKGTPEEIGKAYGNINKEKILTSTIYGLELH